RQRLAEVFSAAVNPHQLRALARSAGNCDQRAFVAGAERRAPNARVILHVIHYRNGITRDGSALGIEFLGNECSLEMVEQVPGYVLTRRISGENQLDFRIVQRTQVDSILVLTRSGVVRGKE